MRTSLRTRPAPAGRRLPGGWRTAFAVTAAMWGGSFLFIKVSLDALSPLQVAFGRCACGALALLAIVAVTRDRLPREPRAWLHLAVAGLLVNALPFTLFAYGETHVSSILAGIWNATTPLLTLLVAMAALPDERPTRERATGLLVGFLGVLVVLGPWSGLGGPSLVGSLACLGAACCYGLGWPFTRRFLAGRPESGVSLMAAQVLCGALELAVVLPLGGAAPDALPPKVVGSMLALGALGTGVAYVANLAVVRAKGATTASSVTYVVPIFATLLGVLVLSENLTWNEPVGAVVILAGIALSRRGP